jgi:hypothetical protein
MTSRFTYALAAAATAATLALTGCGGADTSSAPEPQASTQPSATPPETSSAPSTRTSPTETGSPSAESTATEQSGDGDKPAKSEIVAGLSKFYRQSQGIGGAKAKKFAECMVDEMYDKAKTATLVAMRDGDPTKIDKSDVGLLTQSGVTCQPALA